MAYSPAAILTIYFPTDKNGDDRHCLFLYYLEKWTQHQVFLDKWQVTIKNKWSSDHWVLHSRRRGFSKIDIFLWITYFDGLHENICLEKHRSFIDRLINDQIVDVVSFPYGLTKKNKSRFLSPYEPGVVLGRRPFVAFELIQFKLFSKIDSLVNPINKCLEKNWMELNKEQEIVSVEIKDSKKFLKSCISLPYFNELSSFIDDSCKWYR